MPEQERVRAVVSLWMRRPAIMRTDNDLLVFYGELTKSYPKLLVEPLGKDAYEQLLADLQRYVR